MGDVVGSAAGAADDVSPLGRRPNTDSGETRRSIIEAARIEFARHGFNGASNRTLVSSVGLTAAALYHYFDSKLALYVAVYDDVEQQVRLRFSEVMGQQTGFAERVEAMLDAVHQMNLADPTLSAFVGAARADIRRNPSVAKALARTERNRTYFLDRLVTDAVRSGEVHADRHLVVVDLLDMMLDGLSDGVSDDPDRQQRAMTGIKLLLRGQLLSSSPGSDDC